MSNSRKPPTLDRAESEELKARVNVALDAILAEAWEKHGDRPEAAMLEAGLAAIRWGERTVS